MRVLKTDEIAMNGVHVGDYVELTGEKVNELLFEATEISVGERFSPALTRRQARPRATRRTTTPTMRTTGSRRKPVRGSKSTDCYATRAGRWMLSFWPAISVRRAVQRAGRRDRGQAWTRRPGQRPAPTRRGGGTAARLRPACRRRSCTSPARTPASAASRSAGRRSAPPPPPGAAPSPPPGRWRSAAAPPSPTSWS